MTGVEMQNRTTSAAWIRGVVKTFSSQGLDVPRLFADVGLDYTGLEDPELRWPTEQVSRLWTLAVERSRNPAIALFNPHVVRPDHYGVVGYAMMSSANLHAGLERLIRYLGIVSDAATISLAKGKGGQWVRLDLYGGAAPVPRQRMEYGLLTLLTFCRWMMGWNLAPVSVCFSYPPPIDLRPYNVAFGCDCQFDMDFNAFLMSDKDLKSRLPTAIPQLEELHDRIAGTALSKLHTPTTARRAGDAISRRLQDGSPRRAQIAVDLGVSDHTLQRRLADEGMSFTDLVDADSQRNRALSLGRPTGDVHRDRLHSGLF